MSTFDMHITERRTRNFTCDNFFLISLIHPYLLKYRYVIECFLTAKRSKKKKKNKGKSDPVAQTLTKHAATNSTLEEEEEISLDKRKCPTPLHWYLINTSWATI